MPQSLDNILIHLVFSTKDRVPCLDMDISPGLYAYLAGIGREQGCECLRVGGMPDHVHLAMRLSRTISVAALVEHLKTSSSKWVKLQDPKLSAFTWQRGYGVFSVGPTNLQALLEYIDKQAEHHKVRSFQEEYLSFLKKYKVTFDERYMWD